MQFRTAPAIGPRYWLAISIASIGGANLGDFSTHVLKLGSWEGLPILALLFAAIVVTDRAVSRASVASYWLAILVVRAAATNLADLAIDAAGLNYAVFSALMVAVLAALLILWPVRSDGRVSRSDGVFWLTMLTAGTLGTTLGDGIAHILHPVTVGYPVAAVATSLALAAVFLARSRTATATAAAYWVTVVAVRTWGTNVGDICAFLLTIPGSLVLSLAVLAGLVIAWPKRREPTMSAAA